MTVIPGPGPDSLARRSRRELCVLGREYLLIGHLQDRVSLPLAAKLVGEEAQRQLSIDEWMGASPIYSRRMQRLLRFQGSDVATVFKNLQLDIGAPHQFMDFQFRLDRPDYGEFWLPHCGALLDVEPFGEKRVRAMCHDIEDPTFDATAAATNPRLRMRPIHRPPRVPADRYPHCRWKVYLDDEAAPYAQHPNLALVEKTRIAAVPVELPETDREPGGWTDYSGPFDPGFQLEDLAHRALVAVCQEIPVQAHLLARSLLVAARRRHGEEVARELARGGWTGAAAIGAWRIKRALGLGEGIEDVAEVFRLHPHFLPRTYVALAVEVTGERTARISVGPCPALEEADADSWFGGLTEAGHPALEAIATLVNPRARLRPAEPGEARFAWEVVLDPDAEPRPEPPEMRLARMSRGVDFELMPRRPLRTD